MSDPSSGAPSGGVDGDEASRYAQALRFLVALRSQRHQDVNAQREFLRGKGLSEEVIEQAFKEAEKPESVARDGLVQSVPTHDASAAQLSDEDAFDQAAKMFDDPLHSDDDAQSAHFEGQMQQRASPSLPPRTYPRSPLALYQQQAQGGSLDGAQISSLDNPLTRYHVLLRFFRSICYFLVLGGGMASIAVGVYRAYLMPRLIATLDARSNLLKHHRSLYTTIAGRVRSLRGNSLAPVSAQTHSLEGENVLDGAAPRKGVLKKVQFADEVQHQTATEESAMRDASKASSTTSSGDDEDKKQAGEKPDEAEQEALLKGSKKDLGAEKDGKGEEDEKEEEKTASLPAIDILESWRTSLSRLNKTLRADLSASAIGSPIDADATQTPTSTTAKGQASKSASVEDESDAESWVSEEEDSEELEFDPFAPPSTKSTSSSKRKHAQKSSGERRANLSSTPLADRPTAAGTSATTLKASLNTMNAYLNTQTYMANANVYGSRSLGYGGLGAIHSGTGDGGQSGAANKMGEVGQVRAEIRSLKGLLLSRRNFPIYNRPSAPRVEPTA